MSDPLASKEATGAATTQSRRRARQSIAFAPSSSKEAASAFGREENKENGAGVKSRKARSKSLMPGELEPSGKGKRASLFGGETSAAPRSILKPPIPLSPLQQIPEHQSAKKSNLAAPVVVPLKTEEEQQLEREQREAERTIALKHRAERRKSLGGRRVSFHPEVTLHMLEEVRTPSTQGTEKKSTRRSSMRPKPENTPTPAAAPEPIASDPPSTPPKQVEEQVPSPENARQEHRKINRRSSLGTPNNGGEQTGDLMQLSPTPSSVYSSPGVPDDESILAPDNSDDEDETGVIAASPSVTMHSDMSDDDDAVDRESSPSGNAEIEITGAFKPWVVKPHSHPRLSHPETGFTSAPESERSPPKKIQPWVGKSHDHPRLSRPETGFTSAPPRPLELMENMQDDDGDVPMDTTRVVGPGLVHSPTPMPNHEDDEDDGDAMEVTKVIGRGILRNRDSLAPRSAPVLAQAPEEDEDDAMEVTRVIGRGILSKPRQSLARAAAPRPTEDDDDEMEVTRVIGRGILSKRRENAAPRQTQPSNDEDMTMEITRVIGPGLLSQSASQQAADFNPFQDDGEETMDITRVVGPGLLSQARAGPSRRTSAVSRRLSAATNADNEDEQTMEITRAIGGIEGWKDDRSEILEDEDMSMELTKVVGGFLNRAAKQAQDGPTTVQERSDDEDGSEMELDMEVTRPIGGIISDNSAKPATRQSRRSTIAERTENSSIFEEADLNGVTMNVTSGLPVLPSKRNTSSPVGRDIPSASKQKGSSPTKVSKPPAARTSPTRRNSARLTGSRTSTTPKRDTTPKASTPKSASKRPAQSTPQTTPKKLTTTATPTRAGFFTPQKTVPAEDPEATLPGFGHGLSAKRRIAGNSSAKTTPQRPKAMNSNVSPTPNKIATGVGISRQGLGSPAISKILKSRRSLGEETASAEIFSPGVKSFAEILSDMREDKKDTERFLEEEKKISEEAEKTASLRDLINMLTPKKDNPSKGKSPSPDLAGSKRTFGEVKEDLKAAAAPSTPAGTASPARKKRRSLTGAEPVAPPPPPLPPVFEPTPQKAGPSVKFAASPEKTRTVPIKPAVEPSAAADDEEDSQIEVPHISMKEFLQMVNISFQDHFNATTLRRQTGAFTPRGQGLGRSSMGDDDEEYSLTDRVLAKNMTFPNLALLQHACGELKRYISGGRAAAKQIEKEVQKENPLLFQEYMLSPPEVQAMMDRQFGDLKAYFRLQSRELWYDWRMNLMLGLLEQVPKNYLEPLKVDDELLKKQKALVEQVLPGLEEKHKELESKAVTLRKRNEDVSSCDPDELAEARSKLAKTLKSIEEKKLELQKATEKSNELDETILQREARKATLLSEIEDAEKVKEANRGFSVEEVMQYKRRFEALEKKYKWTIVNVIAPQGLHMRYNDEVDIVFDPTNPNGKRKIRYHPEKPSLQIKYFFDKLAELFGNVKVNESRELLSFVKEKWQHARSIIEKLRKVELHYQIQFNTREEDGKLVARVTLIVPNRKAKIFVYIALDGLEDIAAEISTEVVYGEKMKGWKLDDYLRQVTSDSSTTWKEALQQLVRELNAVPS